MSTIKASTELFTKGYFSKKGTAENILKNVRGYFSNFVQPYKSYNTTGKGVLKDLKQPLEGVKFLGLFIIMLVITPFRKPIAWFLFYFAPFNNTQFNDTPSFLLGTAKGLGLALGSAILLLASTPITWIVRIPMRLITTAIKGSPIVEEGPHLKKLVKEAHEVYTKVVEEKQHAQAPMQNTQAHDESTWDQLSSRLYAIHTKFASNTDPKGENRCTKIATEQESDLYNRVAMISKNTFFAPENKVTIISDYLNLLDTTQTQ